MARNNSDKPTWIDDGEKYALIGLTIKAKSDVVSGTVASQYSVLVDSAFAIPKHWKEWLGSMRAQEIERCNLFLLTKRVAEVAGDLDQESKDLQDSVFQLTNRCSYPARGATKRSVSAH